MSTTAAIVRVMRPLSGSGSGYRPLYKQPPSPDGLSDNICHGAMPLGIEMHLIEKHRRTHPVRAPKSRTRIPSQGGLGLLTKALIVHTMIDIRLNGNKQAIIKRGSHLMHFREIFNIPSCGEGDGGRGDGDLYAKPVPCRFFETAALK